METLERLARLRQLVEASGGRVDGRKKLQKLVYLCQKAGGDLGYSFGFHYYGVYSAELAHDLRVAGRWEILDETEIGLGREDLGRLVLASGIEEHGLEVVRRLKDTQAAVLEVLSTILYLRETGYEGIRLDEKLDELKGHLSSAFAEARKIEKELFSGASAVSA
jgi:uncharacterized protein YwgA